MLAKHAARCFAQPPRRLPLRAWSASCHARNFVPQSDACSVAAACAVFRPETVKFVLSEVPVAAAVCVQPRGMGETGEEPWDECCECDDDGESSDGEGRIMCPGKEGVFWQNDAVYIQTHHSGAPIFGSLSLRQASPDDASAIYIVWHPTDMVSQVLPCSCVHRAWRHKGARGGSARF